MLILFAALVKAPLLASVSEKGVVWAGFLPITSNDVQPDDRSVLRRMSLYLIKYIKTSYAVHGRFPSALRPKKYVLKGLNDRLCLRSPAMAIR